MTLQALTPVLALISWTCVIWVWLYLTRIPAMKAAKIHPNSARHPGTYEEKMPANARAVADNYNHLHEQPTLFYAVMFYAALTSGIGLFVTIAAWVYVAFRVLHSLVQILSSQVVPRFVVFCLGSLALGFIVIAQVIALFA